MIWEGRSLTLLYRCDTHFINIKIKKKLQCRIYCATPLLFGTTHSLATFFALLSKLLKLRVSTEFFLEKTRAEKGTSSQSLAKPLNGNRDTLSLSPLANLLSTESHFIEILHSTYWMLNSSTEKPVLIFWALIKPLQKYSKIDLRIKASQQWVLYLEGIPLTLSSFL